uniref:TNFR-Cys domain-containing protein n=1 Tax=Oreochromis niloticus TaxID=8128 RepID=I3JQQ2_ORENI
TSFPSVEPLGLLLDILCCNQVINIDFLHLKTSFYTNVFWFWFFGFLGHGLSVKQNCTATTDTVCDVLNGYHCKGLIDSNGCSLAEKHSQCAAGQRIKEPGTSTSDTVCEDCEPGFFSKDGVNCTAWTICSESQIIVEEGNSTSDVVCGSAPRHRYGLISFVVLFLIIAICLVITGIVKACKYHLTSVKSAHSAQHLQSLTC